MQLLLASAVPDSYKWIRSHSMPQRPRGYTSHFRVFIPPMFATFDTLAMEAVSTYTLNFTHKVRDTVIFHYIPLSWGFPQMGDPRWLAGWLISMGKSIRKMDDLTEGIPHDFRKLQ